MHWDQICDVMRARQDENAPLITAMLEIRDRYNCDFVVPWIDQLSDVALPAVTPALITEVVDAMGQRAGAANPNIWCPAIDPSKSRGRRSREYANIRRKVLTATFFHSKGKLKLRRAYRHLAGYATAVLLIRDDWETKLPVIEVRDPLNTYPDLHTAEDYGDHANCGFIFGKSTSWLRQTFPECRKELGGVVPKEPGDHEVWDLVEWVDRDSWRIGILGPRKLGFEEPFLGAQQELIHMPNVLGRVPVVTPARVTLDRISSQLTHVTGISDLMARMQLLNVIATERAIFPDRYAIAKDGEAPTILSADGTWQDGRTGILNQLEGVSSVGEIRSTPDPAGRQEIDRLERNIRVSSGLVPQIGGETYGALRTGRGIDALTSVAIDPRVEELQETMAFYLGDLFESALRCYAKVWPKNKYTLMTGWAGDGSTVEFTPEEHIESEFNVVSYPIPGADPQGITIQLGQMLAAGAIGMKTFRRRHPWIADPDAEEAMVLEEELERAALASLQMQAQQGAVPLVFLAMVEEEVRNGADIFEGIRAAEEKLREQQVTQAPPPDPGQIMAPEAAPGLAAGPTAAMQPSAPPPPTVAPPAEGQQNLRMVLSALSAGQSMGAV